MGTGNPDQALIFTEAPSLAPVRPPVCSFTHLFTQQTFTVTSQRLSWALGSGPERFHKEKIDSGPWPHGTSDVLVGDRHGRKSRPGIGHGGPVRGGLAEWEREPPADPEHRKVSAAQRTVPLHGDGQAVSHGEAQEGTPPHTINMSPAPKPTGKARRSWRRPRSRSRAQGGRVSQTQRRPLEKGH